MLIINKSMYLTVIIPYKSLPKSNLNSMSARDEIITSQLISFRRIPWYQKMADVNLYLQASHPANLYQMKFRN